MFGGTKHMNVISEIQKEVIDSNSDVTAILRKAKVLAYQLKLNEFKEWVENELNGYKDRATVPPYRRFRAENLGHFAGSMGTTLNNVPIPLSNIPEEYRKDYSEVVFCESIGAVERFSRDDSHGELRVNWAADILPSLYNKVYDGYSCLQAWQLVSISQPITIINAVRDRLLSFILELQDKYPNVVEEENSFSSIPIENSRQIFNTYIIGDGNTINNPGSAFHNSQINQIAVNDLKALLECVKQLGFSTEETEELREAISSDGQQNNSEFGPKVRAWIGKASEKLLDVSAKVGFEWVIKALAAYYGFTK
jgi:hypothetical protein